MTIRKLFNLYFKTLIGSAILVLAFISLFKRIFISFFDLNVFNYADELILLFSLAVLLPIYLFSQKLSLINILLITFIFYSVIISILFGMNKELLVVILQTLINVKFFIFLLVFIVLFKNKNWIINNFFNRILIISLIGLGLHLIFGEIFNNFFKFPTFARPNIRYTGFLPHPNHLAYLMVLVIGLILNKSKTQFLRIGQVNWIKIFLCLLVIIFTDSRTALIAVFIFFMGYYWSFILKNYKWFVGSIFASILIIAYMYFFTGLVDSIIQNINESLDLESHYIRGNMIYLSALIFYDFFPFGTGSATFGSVLANDSAYKFYDQADRYYFVNEIGVYDSNLASIIGEYGMIGILMYYFLFVVLKKYLMSFSESKNTMINSLIFVFLFFSITNPMLTNDVYILISIPVFILFVLPVKKTHTQKSQ